MERSKSVSPWCLPNAAGNGKAPESQTQPTLVRQYPVPATCVAAADTQ